MAEISRRWSPYNYVENDPVRLTDPDGMMSTIPGADGDGDDEVIAEHKKAVAEKQKQEPAKQVPGPNGIGPKDKTNLPVSNGLPLISVPVVFARSTFDHGVTGLNNNPGMAYNPYMPTYAEDREAAVNEMYLAGGEIGGELVAPLFRSVKTLFEGAELGGKTFRQFKLAMGGTETLDKILTSTGEQRISTEYSHMFITQRMQRLYNLPNWLVNNRLNVWKLNTIQHALIDSYRFRFLRAGIKESVGWFKEYNWFTKF